MQVNNFINYLSQSELISSISEHEILPLVKEFPYCQTGHLMYAIQLNATNSILFEEQLKKAASYCTDRVQLFQHLHQENRTEKKSHEKVINKQVEPSTNLVKEKPILKEKEEKDVLEREYLSQAISSTILLEADEIIKKPEIVVENINEQEINLFDLTTEHTFSEWLKHFSGEEAQNISNSEAEQPIVKKREINQDIIDRFIQEDPRIEPKKTKFYSPTNMARLSVTDSGFVSETLALIHVDQGNFQEAITTYEKLSLKNPKKRSYFADQIKILKLKLKQ